VDTLDSMATSTAVLAAVALGLAAGALLTEGFVLVPYWRELPPEAFFDWYAANGDRLFDFFGPLEIAALSFAAMAAGANRRRPGAACFVAAAVLAFAILASFFVYFGDANARFAARTIEPVRLPEELARWSRWHWARTLIGVAAFATSVAGVRARGRDVAR
jgi:hypothetical protein